LFSPYHLINDAGTYFDSYNVFIPVHDTGCCLLFVTTQQPYIEYYFISFKEYVRDNNAYSLLEEKKIMNYGDLLLGIDGVEIETKHLQDINTAYHAKQTALFS
jgi:hypothetical protein